MCSYTFFIIYNGNNKEFIKEQKTKQKIEHHRVNCNKQLEEWLPRVSDVNDYVAGML